MKAFYISLVFLLNTLVTTPVSSGFFGNFSSLSTEKANEPNRNALLELYGLVKLGDTYEAVLNAYWKTRTDELRIDVDSPDFWYVCMPGELGATDWILNFDFKEKKVSSIKFRSSDGDKPKNKPKESPPDKFIAEAQQGAQPDAGTGRKLTP